MVSACIPLQTGYDTAGSRMRRNMQGSSKRRAQSAGSRRSWIFSYGMIKFAVFDIFDEISRIS